MMDLNDPAEEQLQRQLEQFLEAHPLEITYSSTNPTNKCIHVTMCRTGKTKQAFTTEIENEWPPTDVHLFQILVEAAYVSLEVAPTFDLFCSEYHPEYRPFHDDTEEAKNAEESYEHYTEMATILKMLFTPAEVTSLMGYLTHHLSE